MLYTGSDQPVRMADRPDAPDTRRTFSRRIDCDSRPRQAAASGALRGGAVREPDAWERARRGYAR